jgi:hypothetical protein
MSCERGRVLHAEFEKAVAARISAERLPHLDLGGETVLAKKHEDAALLNRTVHVSRCVECWQRPPN